MNIVRWLAVAMLAALVAGCGTRHAVVADRNGEPLMLLGHDPVSYFTDAKAIRGDPAITARHDGDVYYFVSDEHRRMFVADPAKYAPQYGGFCSSGAAYGVKLGSDPTEWRIRDGRLYIFGDVLGREYWLMDPRWHVEKADALWPEAARTAIATSRSGDSSIACPGTRTARPCTTSGRPRIQASASTTIRAACSPTCSSSTRAGARAKAISSRRWAWSASTRARRPASAWSRRATARRARSGAAVPRLDPAEIEFGDDGTPRSPRYDDVYHSAASGPGQARHVFLGGNALPGRWAGRHDFTILELGLRARRQLPRDVARLARRPGAAGRAPLRRDRLPPAGAGGDARCARAPRRVRGPRARARRALPAPAAGTHVRAFDAGRVRLTLVLDDVETALQRLEATRRRRLPRRLRAVAQSADVERTRASRRRAARTPRRDRRDVVGRTHRARRLARGRLRVERRDGFGPKRDMLAGTYAPRWNAGSDDARSDERHAIVVGAGLAGASAARA
jgi:YHS domain-containing protein